MTRRERMERRLEKRREWAESRKRKSAAAFDRAHKIADSIPLGQPILVGHHSERHARADARKIENAMRAGCESADMAAHHISRAGGIAAQLERSVFTDDTDAPERLRERIAELEATRDARKRANAAFKSGGIDAMRAEVGDAMALDGARTMQLCPWEKVPFPPYSISNIGGNIRRLKARLPDVDRLAEQRARVREALAAEAQS